ncbi:hypothetical protein [Kutzneria sp. 744]|uniref:hypothetical protein n=1 Tax=Kutzneria sp. (strain 744) TaxID=345341 RepID=UPI0003EEDFE7|nr:hypothetical protein [Kutzneria sp. 744]EWM09846.1 hypothetical protein KUTG_00150 [Kutzneria sp. 744]
MRSAPLVLAGVLLSVAACSTTPPQTSPAAQAPVCADTLPQQPTTGAATPMVPGEPQAAVICQYTAVQQHLAKSTQVKDVQGLQKALNAADTTPPPRGTMCPLDHGGRDMVIFAYAGGDPVDVTIKTSGCATATNGKVTAYRLTDAVLGKL